jgi:5-methylcytosine-specific restriction endonuclease McrA
MNNRRDRSLLLSAARDLRDELESRSHGGAFVAAANVKIKKVGTDGWLARLGHTYPMRLQLELWFDRYPATKSRRFYYGFFTGNSVKMQALKKQLPAHLRPIRTLKKDDYSKYSAGVWLLTRPLKKAEFNKPIYEQYHYGRVTNFYFYGEYVPTEKPTIDNVHRITMRAADFFSDVMWLLPEQPKAETKTKVYPQLERSVVRRHLVRERSSKLADACKRRDGYRCKVCKMTFAEVYGEELGAEFAEAHHLHPLSKKLAKEKTRLDDLVTVCSNCHRMLHQMRGREHDLDELKRVIQIQEKKN